MRLLSSKEHIPLTVMDGADTLLPPAVEQKKKRKRLFSMPLPGADMFRVGRRLNGADREHN